MCALRRHRSIFASRQSEQSRRTLSALRKQANSDILSKKCIATLPSILNMFLFALCRLKMDIVFKREGNVANFANFKILMTLCNQAYRPVFVHGGHHTKIALVTHTAENCICSCTMSLVQHENYGVFARDLSPYKSCHFYK